MCLKLYLGSSHALIEEAWDEQHRPVVLDRELAAWGEVPACLPFDHIYTVSSHMGCGCGFAKLDASEPDYAERLANYAHLADIIQTALDAGAELRLYACTGGEEYLPCERSTTITVDDMRQPPFDFAEQWCYQVVELARG